MDEPPSPLEQIRRRLALGVGENAAFDGWTPAAVDAAADTLGIERVQAQLAMPDNPAGLIDLYIQAVDRAMEAEFPPERVAAMKVRARIREMVWTRIRIMAPAKEAVRRALAILALPQNLPLATRTGWRSADLMWRVAGDTATDFNHYTKRLTLSAVYGSTLLAWMSDGSEGYADTAAFLDRRIDDVMRFEKWKVGWRSDPINRPSLTRFLGRLRYPPK